jgi:hypothetical protein
MYLVATFRAANKGADQGSDLIQIEILQPFTGNVMSLYERFEREALINIKTNPKLYEVTCLILHVLESLFYSKL